MIYELFYPLKFHYSWLSWLNVLRYIPFRFHLGEQHQADGIVGVHRNLVRCEQLGKPVT